MRKDNDIFDEADNDGIFHNLLGFLGARNDVEERRPFGAVAFIVATIVVFATVMFYAYPREAAQQEIDMAPIIRADVNALKYAPDEPGGMNIPHRQSVVFDAIEQEHRQRVENILPEQERPLVRDVVFAGLNTDVLDEEKTAVAAEELQKDSAMKAPKSFDELASFDDVKGQAKEAEKVVQEAVSVTEQSAVAAQEIEQVAPKEIAKSVAQDVAKTEPAAGVTSVGGVIAKGTSYVQLASVKDEASAAVEYKKMQAQFGELSPLSMRTQRADLGTKGVFYRIQAGPVSEEDARKLCASISAKKPGGCLVVK
jgi:hypothetical protein